MNDSIRPAGEAPRAIRDAANVGAPPSVRERVALLALLGLTFVIRAAVAMAHHTSLIALEIYKDDAFYYFQVARNWALGRGLSFDGVATTNGFQPLFLLILRAVYAFYPSDPIAPLHVAGWIAAFTATGSGYLLYRLARPSAGFKAALGLVALYALSPYFIVHDVNGQETALSVLLGLGVLWAYAAWMDGGGPLRWRGAIGFGFLCGLAVLARIDLAILAASLGLVWVRDWWRRGRLAKPLLGVAAAATVAALTWLPWGVFSRSATGHWLPLSGPASKRIALELGWSALPRIWDPLPPGDSRPRSVDRLLFDPDHVPGAFYADVAAKEVFLFLYENPLLAPLRITAPFSPHPTLEGFAPYELFRAWPRGVALIGGVGLAGVLLPVWRRRKLGEANSRTALVAPVGIYLLATLVSYPLAAPTHWNFNRYLVLPVLLSMVYVAAALGTRLAAASATSRGRFGGRALGLALIACQLVAARSLADLSWKPVPESGFLRAWTRIEPHLEAHEGFGAFQAGVFGYFSGRDVVNLDGKINTDAFIAMSAKQLYAYILQRGIHYVADWDLIFYAMCTRHAPEGAFRFRRVPIDPDSAGVSMFEVLPPDHASDGKNVAGGAEPPSQDSR